MADLVKVFALGGLDEYGKNLYVIDINNDLFVFECGIKFPDKTGRGIDFIIADYSFLTENKDRVKAIFVSHGHEDQMGGLGYLFTKAGITAPVYASNVSIAFIKRDMSRIGLNPAITFIPVKGGQTLSIAGREFVFFDTCHSIMGSIGFAIWTDMGYIVYTGNYIVEYNSANSKYRLDIVTLSKLASKGIALLMTESIESDEPGFTSPHHKLTPFIQKPFEDAQGRVFVAMYDYDIYHLCEVVNLCTQMNKKVLYLVKETNSIIQTLNSVNEVVIPKKNIVSIQDILRVREQDLVVIIQAHRKSLFSLISSISTGNYEEKTVEIKPTDTFIFAAPPVIGIENVVVDTVDDVYRTGCSVVYLTHKNICSMHAHADDLNTLLSILRPKYYLPIVGEYRKLLSNAKLAVESNLGYSHLNTFILDNGMVLEMSKDGCKLSNETIKVGDLLVDGIGVGDVGGVVLEDRQKLADNGVVCMAVSISSKEKKVIAGPDIQMRGFVLVKDSESLIHELADILTSACDEIMNKNGIIPEMQEIVLEKATRLIRKTTGRDPMVLPLIVDIDEEHNI